MTRGLRRFPLPTLGVRRLALAALVLAAGLVATLVSSPTAGAAAPASKPWFYSQAPAHLGFQLYWYDGYPDTRDDPSVTGYDVQYRETGSTTWLSWSHSGTVRAVEFSNLTAGTAYQVRVRATNNDGNSRWSEIEDVSAVVSLATTVNPPFPVQVVPGDAQVRVTWGRPSHTGGQTLTGYVVRLYSDPETQLRRIEISDPAATSQVIGSLTNGREYLIDVYATAGANDEGGRSVLVPFTPSGTTRTTGVELSAETLTVAEGGSGTFTVALTDDPGSDLTISLVNTQYFGQYGDSGTVWDKDAVSVSPDALTFTAGSSGNWNTPQTVTVSAPQDADGHDEQLAVLVLVETTAGSGDTNPGYEPVGGAGAGVDGIFVTVADSAETGPPANLQALAGKAQMTVQQDGEPVEVGRWLARFSWDAPDGSQTVTGYDLQWKLLDGTWPVGVTSLGASDTSLIIRPSVGDNADESEDTALHFRVRTRTADGVSGWETVWFSLADPANLVANLQVNPGSDPELHLFWNAPAFWPVTGYDVEYKVADAPDSQAASDPENGWVDAGHTGTDNFDLIPNLKDGTTYAVRVRLTSDWDFSWVVAEGTTAGTAPAIGGSEGGGGSEGSGGSAPDAEEVTRPEEGSSSEQDGYAGFIADMKEWRDDPCCAHDKAHTDRWDRALLAFGETVFDASLTPMTADEARELADRGWTRWERVAEALAELEAAPESRPEAPNSAPTVSVAMVDATIATEGGTQRVSLSGVFSDADKDALTVTAASSNEAVAAVSVASDYTGLTVTAKSRGTATITVTADDGNGGTVSDIFTVRVKAAPLVASALADLSGLETGNTRDVSLSGVFSDADGDTLTITAASSNEATATVTVAADQSTLTVVGAAQGTATITVTAQDSDGNAVSDTFDVTVTVPQQPNADAPTPVANLHCVAETSRVAFLWDTPEWSGGEVYAYDYELTLPGGRSESGRIFGSTLLLRPGKYQAGAEASVSVKVVYEHSDGSNMSSAEATLSCTVVV